MAVIGLLPSVISTTGFAIALLADYLLGLPTAVELPVLGVRNEWMRSSNIVYF